MKSTCGTEVESRRDEESQFRSVQETNVHLTSPVHEEAAGEMQRNAAEGGKKRANDLQAAVSAYESPTRNTFRDERCAMEDRYRLYKQDSRSV